MSNFEKELLEARAAAENVLDTIGLARERLKKAKNWGLFDILGGGLIASLVKRNHIGEMRNIFDTLDRQLEIMTREMKDVHMESPEGPGDSFAMQLMDIGFDNVFTDLYVQSELRETGYQLDRLEDTVRQILDELDEALKTA